MSSLCFCKIAQRILFACVDFTILFSISEVTLLYQFEKVNFIWFEVTKVVVSVWNYSNPPHFGSSRLVVSQIKKEVPSLTRRLRHHVAWGLEPCVVVLRAGAGCEDGGRRGRAGPQHCGRNDWNDRGAPTAAGKSWRTPGRRKHRVPGAVFLWVLSRVLSGELFF